MRSSGGRRKQLAIVGAMCLEAAACTRTAEPVTPARATVFAADVDFLRKHTQVVLLTDPSGSAQVAVAPAYQGRVMTSTTSGSDGPSFGWIGRAAIASGTRQLHMNVFGGEDRFWLGPEGGQYALYFKRGDPFDLDHWQVPGPFDWDRWDIAGQSATDVRFRKPMTLVNYSGTQMTIDVDRTVRLLSGTDVTRLLGVSPGNAVRTVAFESSNTVTNAGSAEWKPETGLVSVWILGMFNPSTDTTIVLPFTPGPESTLGPIVNDAYFGKVPAGRLVIAPSAVFFRGDGQYRSKIGLSPSRAVETAASYDTSGHVLTLVQYTRPAGATRYVNSMWEIQREPYKGDVINSYNDGPPEPGKPPLGPFFELETSSPALALAPAQQHTHVHRTFHFVGPEAELDRLARVTINVGLNDIAAAFASTRGR
jgi:hypothetical protein